jgi:electron transport complex protein RnfE
MLTGDMATLREEFTKGIFRDNPVLILLLGLCPTLAVSTSLENGLGMGLAATGVLLCCNIIISLIRKIVPKEIRIPCYICVIATFVTIVEFIMKGYFPKLDAQLGIFIPLIVVNCIIMGRAEAFASKNGLGRSILDAFGIGLGFIVALLVISGVREITGSGTFFNIPIANWESLRKAGILDPAAVMIMPPGAFLLIGVILGIVNWRKIKKSKKMRSEE